MKMVIETTKLIAELELEKVAIIYGPGNSGEGLRPSEEKLLKEIDDKLTKLYRWVGKSEYEILAQRANY